MPDNEDDDVGEPESASTLAEQRRQFNAGMNEELSKLKGETSCGTQFLTPEKYADVVASFDAAAAGANLKSVQKDFPQVYKWEKKYALLRFPDSANVLAFKDDPGEALDTTMVAALLCRLRSRTSTVQRPMRQTRLSLSWSW